MDSESSSMSSSSLSSESSSVFRPCVVAAPIMYPCVQQNSSQVPNAYSTFGTMVSMGKSFLWSDSRQNETITSAPSRYSLYSRLFNKSVAGVWNFNRAPVFILGDNEKTYIGSVLYPFLNSSILDYSNVIKYLEYRIADDNWVRLDIVGTDYDSSIKAIQYHYKKIGSVPCQLRAVLQDDEIVYSKEKYVFVTSDNLTEIQAFLTSKTDSYTSDMENSLGGICSRVPLSISSDMVQNEGMSSMQNYIVVDSSSSFPTGGYVAIGDEVIGYNGKTYSYPYKLLGCTRGRFGTEPTSHKKNSKVRLLSMEGLFGHITKNDLEASDKVDYKCLCLKNTKDIESGNISLHFSMLPPETSKENLYFAIERASVGNTAFSQEIVNRFAEPFVSSSNVPVVANLSPSVFEWNGKTSLLFVPPSKFGYISRRNVEDDGEYIFLTKDSIEGEIVYRFFNADTFFTAEYMSYNSSSIDGTSVAVSYRWGNSETELLQTDWEAYDVENHEAVTQISRNIQQHCKYIDIRIKLDRKEIYDPSPSLGNLSLVYWTNGYSRFMEAGDRNTSRTLVIEGDQFKKIFDEFYVDYPEETSSNLKPLNGNDRYIIQSTYANAVGHDSYPIKFNQGLAFSFMPYQKCELNEMVLFEKRIDWDDSVYPSIDLTLNVLIYDGNPENEGKVIGTSTQQLELTSKVAHASHRVFSFDKPLNLEAERQYWVYAYCNSSPTVSGEWRFRGTYDMLYGNPDENGMKIYETVNGMSKRYDVDGFAMGFTAIGKISDILCGHHSENSTIYYRLAPSGLSKEWEFTGINLDLNTPYNHPYKIGPYIHAMWKKNTDDGWHRFRPRKISVGNGVQFLAPSSAYKIIQPNETIIIRLEIDKIMDSDNIEDIRGFGEYGLGIQPSVTRVEALWKQKLSENFISNIVTNWMSVPVGEENSIKMSEIYSGWSDNLSPYEQFFVWIKRDYSEVASPVRDSGFTLVVNHGVEKFYEISEYNSNDWTPVAQETVPGAIESIIVPASSNDGIYEVSWSAVDGAVFYKLQESDGNWQTLTITSETSYIVSGNVDGNYIYRVRAINSSGLGEYTTSSVVVVKLAVREESSSSSSSASSESSESSSSDSSSSSSGI